MKLVHVGTIESKYGDPEAFGERELQEKVDLSKFLYGTKVYAKVEVPGEWGLKEFRGLMEARYKESRNLTNIPNWIVPGSAEANLYIQTKLETYRDVLEMMPEI